MDSHKANGAMLERHFSVAVLAELWNYSADTIQRWFEDESGVVKSGEPGGRGKRRRITLRIPESVAFRVYQDRVK